MKFIVKGTEKGVIFCIHGNSSSAKVYEGLLEFDEIQHTKIAIDLKGHGENQNIDYTLTDFSFRSHKEFLIKEISKIKENILLIGNSLGGHLAIEIANEIKNLKGLVIMGTSPVKKPINFTEAFLPAVALNTFLTEKPTEKEIKEAVETAVEDKAKRIIVINDFKKANPKVRKAIAIDFMEDKLLNQFVIFSKLNIPKYIIAGGNDPSVNRVYLDVIKNNSKNPFKIFDIQNSGHYPSIDKPKEFNKIIKKIVKEVF